MPQISQTTIAQLKNAGVRAVAKETGLNPGTVSRAISTGKAGVAAVALLEKIKGRLREKVEFEGSPGVAIVAPRRDRPIHSWSLETIRAARDAQMAGQFKLPVQLAKAMRTDSALYTAFHNRIAPQPAIEALLVAAPGARGERARIKALSSCIAPKKVLTGIHGTLANHGIAIGYNEQQTNKEGTRTDYRLTEWPLEFVRWDESKECIVTRVKNGGEIPIVHGDGRWTVFQKVENESWAHEACVLPGSLVWAAHANGIKDWAQASTSHGQAKILGELPPGIALQLENGQLTPQAAAYLAMLQDMVAGDIGAGIAPSGAKTGFLSNGSTAWQVFSELISDRKKAAAYIYLGTDATLGAAGGAPGVDISALFGIAITKLQGDFQAIQDGLRVGLYEPWCAVNEGDSRNAPTLVYQLPDTDAEQKIEQNDKRMSSFFARVKELKESGMVVDQPVINKLAAQYKIDPSLVQLMPTAKVSVPLVITPSTTEKIATIDELRTSQGLLPTGTPRGAMSLPQAAAATAAAATAASQQPATTPAPAAPGAA